MTLDELIIRHGHELTALLSRGKKFTFKGFRFYTRADKPTTKPLVCETCKDTGWITTSYPNGPEFQCSCPDCHGDHVPETTGDGLPF